MNKQTFLGADGHLLAKQIHIAMDNDNLDLLLLHENDDALGGCEFGRRVGGGLPHASCMLLRRLACVLVGIGHACAHVLTYTHERCSEIPLFEL